jgi:hypothetical protein
MAVEKAVQNPVQRNAEDAANSGAAASRGGSQDIEEFEVSRYLSKPYAACHENLQFTANPPSGGQGIRTLNRLPGT